MKTNSYAVNKELEEMSRLNASAKKRDYSVVVAIGWFVAITAIAFAFYGH